MKEVSRHIVASTEGQAPPFSPPINFTDLDGSVYRFGNQLPLAYNAKEVTYLYYVPIPDKPGMTRQQKLFRPSYIEDVIREQELEMQRAQKPIMLEGKEYFVHGQAHKPEDKNKVDPYLLLFHHTEAGAEGLKVVRKGDMLGERG